MITPRDYQSETVTAINDYFIGQRGSNPIVVAPTAAGKSICIALYCESMLKQWPQCRFAMLTHQKELIEQNYEKLMTIWPDADAGIYSAGVGRKDSDNQIIFAGIQSVYNKDIGRFDVLLIDECHLIPKSGSGMYRTFIEKQMELNPNLKVIGYTATPYRLQGGKLYEGKNRLFDGVAYEISVKMLIERGYIVPPITPDQSVSQLNVDDVDISGGDFVQYKLAQAVDKADLVDTACREMVQLAKDRKTWLVFATSIEHAYHISDNLNSKGISSAVVTGKTKKKDREALIAKLKNVEIRCLVNVGCLTTGVDVPNIDMVAMLRPTQSTSLYIQMIGRGVRLYEGKENCLVLDFAGNILRHGSFDDPDVQKTSEPSGNGEAPTKNCEGCDKQVHAALQQCPFCGFMFPEREMEDKHSDFVSTLSLISGDKEGEKTFNVGRIDFNLHRKIGSNDTCRVDYFKPTGTKICSEYLCFEHGGWAKDRAVRWWASVMPEHELPLNSLNAAVSLSMFARDRISQITVTTTGKYKEVIRRKLNLENINVGQHVI